MLNEKHTKGLTSEECAKLERILKRMKENNDTHDISEYPPTPFLLIYTLNRIKENDPAVTKLQIDLNRDNPGLSGNQLANELANVLKNNTNLKTISIKNAHLTDDGIKPLIDILNKKEMKSIDFSGNDFTDSTTAFLIERFLNKNEPKWENLGLRNTIVGYKGEEYAAIAETIMEEQGTRSAFSFSAETPFERDQRLARFITSHPKCTDKIPPSFYVRGREF